MTLTHERRVFKRAGRGEGPAPLAHIYAIDGRTHCVIVELARVHRGAPEASRDARERETAAREGAGEHLERDTAGDHSSGGN